jgi:hypothetical protein
MRTNIKRDIETLRKKVLNDKTPVKQIVKEAGVPEGSLRRIRYTGQANVSNWTKLERYYNRRG